MVDPRPRSASSFLPRYPTFLNISQPKRAFVRVSLRRNPRSESRTNGNFQRRSLDLDRRDWSEVDARKLVGTYVNVRWSGVLLDRWAGKVTRTRWYLDAEPLEIRRRMIPGLTSDTDARRLSFFLSRYSAILPGKPKAHSWKSGRVCRKNNGSRTARRF